MSVNEEYRKVLLEIADWAMNQGPGFGQEGTVLRNAAERLSISNNLEKEQQLLSAWQDLFRQGDLAWGYNLNNPSYPFIHKPK